MPIYEYECDACGHRLESIQKFSDPPLVDCPECAGAHLRKLVSAAGFRLSGGGWYETDFKKDKKRNLRDGDGKAAESPAAASSSCACSGCPAAGGGGATVSPG